MTGGRGNNYIEAWDGRFYMRRRARAPGDDPLCPAELTLNLKPVVAKFHPRLDGYSNGEVYSNLVRVDKNGTVVRCSSIKLSGKTRVLAIGFGLETTTPEGGLGPLDLTTALEFQVMSYTLGGFYSGFPGRRGRCTTAIFRAACDVMRSGTGAGLCRVSLATTNEPPCCKHS